jgi:hypothetical protein
MERLATILLPNPVAAHDTKQGLMDGSVKIFKENNTVQNGSSRVEMAVTEFRVRCIQPLCHLSASLRHGLSVVGLYLAAPGMGHKSGTF